MKTKFWIPIIVGVILVGIVLFMISINKASHTNFKYDIEYDDLATRTVYAFSIPASEIIPERTCHKFTTEELSSLSPDLKNIMEESTKSLYPEDIQNGFYSGYSNQINFDEAKKMMEKYGFVVTQKEVYDSLNKINDTTYHFECIFEDGKYQYKLGFDFDSHYAQGERLVFVNLTKNNQGIPIIENQHVKIFQGGFNGTVIFNNKLDSKITINTTNSPPDGEWADYRLENEMIIPAGKVWSVSPRNHSSSNDLVYQYIITPENLQGTITLKSYPRCMTENEVKSLYSQVEVYPKFPSYLPKGYSYECGVHNTNSFVHLGYWNDALREKYDDKVNALFQQEFFEDGGISVDYYDVFASNFWSHDENYDKFEKAKEYAQYPLATTLSIEGEPAVMYQEYVWGSGKQQSYNILQIFSDNGWYRIRSGLPETELIKIAESLVGLEKVKDDSLKQEILEQLRKEPKNLTDKAKEFILSEALSDKRVSDLLGDSKYQIFWTINSELGESSIKYHYGITFQLNQKDEVSVVYDPQQEKITSVELGEAFGSSSGEAIPEIKISKSETTHETSTNSTNTVINNTSCSQKYYFQKDGLISVLILPLNSEGKLCVEYNNPNLAVTPYHRIYEADSNLEAKDVKIIPSEPIIPTGNSTKIYTIQSGNTTGFYDVFLACNDARLAVGYNLESEIVRDDFPRLNGTLHCPPLANYDIVGFDNMQVKYISGFD